MRVGENKIVFSYFFLPTLLPHFHPFSVSLYSSGLRMLWKQLEKVEAKVASTLNLHQIIY